MVFAGRLHMLRVRAAIMCDLMERNENAQEPQHGCGEGAHPTHDGILLLVLGLAGSVPHHCRAIEAGADHYIGIEGPEADGCDSVGVALRASERPAMK